jgi:hypothetical protein
MTDDRPPICPLCHQPMKLVRRIPALGSLPTLQAFYCAPCRHAEAKEQDRTASVGYLS